MALTPRQQRFVHEYLTDLNATQAAIRAGYALRQLPPASGYYVYFLLDGARICYVGKGKGRRMFQHARDHKAGRIGGARKHRHLERMWQEGREPVPVAWECDLSERDALRLERATILALGRASLANSRAGESSPQDILLLRVEGMIARVKPYETWRREFTQERGRLPTEFEDGIATGLLPALMAERVALLAGTLQCRL